MLPQAGGHGAPGCSCEALPSGSKRKPEMVWNLTCHLLMPCRGAQIVPNGLMSPTRNRLAAATDKKLQFPLRFPKVSSSPHQFDLVWDTA